MYTNYTYTVKRLTENCIEQLFEQLYILLNK